MAAQAWQSRTVQPVDGVQQSVVGGPQSQWGAPGTGNGQGPRHPYGPPAGPPNYGQSPGSAPPYRGPAQVNPGSGRPLPPPPPPPPLPPGSSSGALQAGLHAPPSSVQPLQSYGHRMGSYSVSRWQPPAPGCTPAPPLQPLVGRVTSEGIQLGASRPASPPVVPQLPGASQSATTSPVSTTLGPPPYQQYPSGLRSLPLPIVSRLLPPQPSGQMQQRPPFSNYPSHVQTTYRSHQHTVQDCVGTGSPGGLCGKDLSPSKEASNPQTGGWGSRPLYGMPTSLSPYFKDKVLETNGRPPPAQSVQPKLVIPGSGDAPLKREAGEVLDSWTAHKTADGAVYYYNSSKGQSTYEKPANFRGEAEKITSQPTPVSWERLNGTEWALVTTNDGKKYYYNTTSQATSWQVPTEVLEQRKKQGEESMVKARTEGVTMVEKGTVSFSLNVLAAASGGREAAGHKVLVTNNALDLIKRKLQDPGAPTVSSLTPALGGPSTGNSSMMADIMSTKMESGKEKLKGNSVDAVSSDSSSESDEEDPGPTKEDRIMRFKEMLKEKGIAPFSKWEKELPKILFDLRFKAIPSHTERRSIFEHYVRTRADEERKEKRAAQKAAVEGFKQLLEEATQVLNLFCRKRAINGPLIDFGAYQAIPLLIRLLVCQQMQRWLPRFNHSFLLKNLELSYHTTYDHFTRIWGQDARFEALDRKDQEALLNERILPLKRAEEERLNLEQAAAVGGFRAMLVERTDINITTRWSKVREGFRTDPRYMAVKRDERDGLFNAYIAELVSAEQEAERAVKTKRDEEEKLKEREREMRKRKEREELEMERVRVKARRKDAVTAYQALLTEKIKDPEATWTDARPKLEKDPLGRATSSELEPSDRERFFREHISEIFERCVREYRGLLADVITSEVASKNDNGKLILTSWSEAKKLLKPDPRYAKMPRRNRESWWRRYAEDVQRRMKVAASATVPKADRQVYGNGRIIGASVESSSRSPAPRRIASRR